MAKPLLQMGKDELSGRMVVVRSDLNVPYKDGKLAVTTRIDESLATYEHVLENGGYLRILSHIGRHKEGLSLRPVVDYLSKKLGKDVSFVKDCLKFPDSSKAEVVLGENTRLYKQDEDYAKDPMAHGKFVKELLDQFKGGVFVYDAWATAHREQATTTGAVLYARHSNMKVAVGPLVHKEQEHLKSFAEDTGELSIAIIGGAKLSEKVPAMQAFCEAGWLVMPGGVPLNNALKVMYGKEAVGASRMSEKDESYEPEVRKMMELFKRRVILPEQVEAGPLNQKRDASSIWTTAKQGMRIPEGFAVYDFAPGQEAEMLLRRAERVLFCGPPSHYGLGYHHANGRLAESMNDVPRSAIMGGDSVAAVRAARARFSGTVSTGGGASIEYVTKHTLPVLEALERLA